MPTAYLPHLRSALRELLTQRVGGWRLTAVILILVVGIIVGQAIADAASVRNGWLVTGLQAAVIVGLVLVTAVVVAFGRWRAARRR